MPCSLSALEHMKPRPKTVLPAPHVPLSRTRSFSGIPPSIRSSKPGIPTFVLFIKTLTYHLEKFLRILLVEQQIPRSFLHVVDVPVRHPFYQRFAPGNVPEYGVYRYTPFRGYLVKHP